MSTREDVKKRLAMSAKDLVLIAKAEWEQKDAVAMEAWHKWKRLEAQSICASCGKPK